MAAKEYIERDAAFAAIVDKVDLTEDLRLNLIARIQAIPSADVKTAEVGKWVKKYRGQVNSYCSVCGKESGRQTNFCPRCGAMEVGEWLDY